ncbi:carboxymuconolactone decarboxylase family protein [Thermomonospora catenispora]|uniref:carboxymuconolactone decarboxylase family protein n=1 Tax=Thermomonospora catenispora TaxID=2493090 RepID=UPI0019D5DCD2|nr:carboxymuconolactone decarboxylase family protein [Thermomonospora catenispora]
MTRISLNPPRRAWYRLAERIARRRFGEVPDPGRAMGHHRGVVLGYSMLEMQATRWRTVDRALKDLAVMAAAVKIGCAWCVDFGTWELHMHGVPPEKIRAVPHWRDSDLFTPVERLVMEYAEAMTDTPPSVTDELTAALREHGFDDARLVELTMMVALENLRSRFNAAAGLTGQGFKERCEIPPRAGKGVR